MAQFEGSWTTTGEREGFEEMMTYMGLGANIDKFRNLQSTHKYSIDGNTWTQTMTSNAYPGVEKKCNFEIGKEFETHGYDGSLVKSVVNVISDSEISEVQRGKMMDGKWREYTINKKITGDILVLTMTAESHVLKFSFQKHKD